MRRRCCLLSLVALGAALPFSAAPAGAQTPAPPPTTQPMPPSLPPPPDLVISGRDVRMTRAGTVPIRLGCRDNAAAGEACIGSVTLHMANAAKIFGPRPKNGGQPPILTIRPFNFAVKDFTLVAGDAAQVRLRASPLAQRVIRQNIAVRVDVIVKYNSRAGASGSAKRNVRVYFPSAPGH